MTQLGTAIALLGLLIVSGIGDARGFVHAARIWEPGHRVWHEIARSAGWFAMGISAYWLALFWARRLGIVSAGIQTLLWFAVTLVGVAVITGDVARWHATDRALATLLAVTVAALLYRHASA